VVADPRRNDSLGLLVGSKAVLPDAFEFERAHARLGGAVLLGRVRQDELLREIVSKRLIRLSGLQLRPGSDHKAQSNSWLDAVT
jgi:hypothetical protein